MAFMFSKKKEAHMDQRTMVKILAREETFSLRTFSRKHPLSRSFIILRKKLRELEEKKMVIVSDIYSFAVLWLCEGEQGIPVLEIGFSWLNGSEDGHLSGEQETVRVNYNVFLANLAESERLDGKEISILSLPKGRKPKIEFHSRRNLKEAAREKSIRKKLGKFLGRHFDWKDAERILITDDCLPYSFLFTEMRGEKQGVCGGITFHRPENPQKAYYGMHT